MWPTHGITQPARRRPYPPRVKLQLLKLLAPTKFPAKPSRFIPLEAIHSPASFSQNFQITRSPVSRFRNFPSIKIPPNPSLHVKPKLKISDSFFSSESLKCLPFPKSRFSPPIQIGFVCFRSSTLRSGRCIRRRKPPSGPRRKSTSLRISAIGRISPMTNATSSNTSWRFSPHLTESSLKTLQGGL